MNQDFAKDFVALVNSLSDIPKDSSVSYRDRSGRAVDFHYASLDVILATVKKDSASIAIFFKIRQTFGDDGSLLLSVRPCAMHTCGEIFEGDTITATIPAGTSEQQIGAKITYFKRYAVSGFLGISSDEDTDATDQVPAQVPAKRGRPRKEVAAAPAPAPAVQVTAPAPMESNTQSELGMLSTQLIEMGIYEDKPAVFSMLNQQLGHTMQRTEEDGQAALRILRAAVNRYISEAFPAEEKSENPPEDEQEDPGF